MPKFAASPPQKDFEYLQAHEKPKPGQLPVTPGPVVQVAIGSLLVAGSPRSAGEDPEHVRALAETPDELPPILVHRPTMRVIDGLHRLRAAQIRNRTDIAVRFFDGDEADAFVLAVQANVAHGLPLSLPDRKAAAVSIIASHPQWSDRLIASVTGLSPKTIAEVRRGGGPRGTEPTSRIGQDGRVRPVNSLEKRRIASALMQGDPSLSLRQVARTAGISPETARAVRARLLVGEDPVATRRRGPRRAPAAPSAPAPDWPSVVQHLRSDPTLRFTETGRILLRLLDMHLMPVEKWATIVNTVPPHSRPMIAKVAAECARVWRSFAEHLERTA